MDFIEWSYEYSLNIPKIDKQHKELIRQLNNAIKHCTGKTNDEKVFYKKNTRKSIDFLKNHFETEEKILGKTKYENFNKHKSDHNNILVKLIKMNDDIENNMVELNLFHVTAFIKEMVIKHIKTYDLSAKKYFVEGNEIN
jgi:hemerythrin